jgi:hypothetical protein
MTAQDVVRLLLPYDTAGLTCESLDGLLGLLDIPHHLRPGMYYHLPGQGISVSTGCGQLWIFHDQEWRRLGVYARNHGLLEDQQ